MYSRIIIPDTIVLIGPNHTGLGAPVSLMGEGDWVTPLGTVPIHRGLAEALLGASRRISDDTLAHLREHSLEVQLPFLQILKKEFSIAPIQMMDIRLETCVDLGNAVARAITELGDRDAGFKAGGTLIVASSDMSHYVSAETAKNRDMAAIERLLALDGEGLFSVVRDEEISMCGYGPAVAMVTACNALGAKNAELVRYTNSGEVSGDFKQVVGYAGVVVY